MRIVLTGGGSGGHIVPNIALIERLKNLEPKPKILYIGSRFGDDRQLIVEFKIPFKGIFCGKLRRYFSFENFVDFFKIPIGIVQAFFIMSKFQPDIIFSKGGFVSIPVVIAGWLLRKRIIIHESDVIPGLANRIAARFAQVICTAFPETVKFFSQKEKVHVTGNPVRPRVISGRKKDGYRMTGFSSDLPVILVIGGSQGAHQLNVLIWKNLKRLLPLCQIIHICGHGKKGVALGALGLKRYAQYEFLDRGLRHLYRIADLIVSRAGANTLAEIAILKKPSVLVPLSTAVSRGDQIENAKIFEKKEVSVVLNSDTVTADSFFETVSDLITHRSKLAQIERNYEQNFEENRAVDKILELLIPKTPNQ